VESEPDAEKTVAMMAEEEKKYAKWAI